jgi:ubiquitin C-terminal hydrolase
VIHSGTAESGHYYSFIKDEDNKWFEFNDTIVKPFSFKGNVLYILIDM